MRLSEGVEWGLHCAVLLAVLPADTPLATGRLAEYHGVPVAYLAKHLQAMSRAGILAAGPGRGGGDRLGGPPAGAAAVGGAPCARPPAPSSRRSPSGGHARGNTPLFSASRPAGAPPPQYR